MQSGQRLSAKQSELRQADNQCRPRSIFARFADASEPPVGQLDRPVGRKLASTMSVSVAPAPDGRHELREHRRHDLREHRIAELRYPAESLLVLGGVPGAGKTTLLRRVFTTTGEESTSVLTAEGVWVLDSEHARNWWRRYLGRMPYRWWRPLVHATHYRRLLRTLRGSDAPIVVHDCATRPWTRRLITTAARRSRRQVHLLLLDVSPDVASAGQTTRRRRVRPSSFATHCRNWRRLLQAVNEPTDPIHRHTASITLIDRATAAHLQTIRFWTSHPARPRGLP
jgi:AAA domain